MKKGVTALAIFSCLLMVGPLSAQLKRPGLFVGGNFLYNSPVGSFNNNYKSGIGLEISGGIGMGKTFLVATYGSSRFLSKPGVKDITIKPLKVGVKQFLVGRHVFVAANAGSVRVNNKTNNSTSSQFIGDIGAGLRLAGFEAGLYYSGWRQNNDPHRFMQYKIGYSILL